ncbi:MAG: biotin/lipoyl-containing protein, partial [Alphaproteobacteria bacterium]
HGYFPMPVLHRGRLVARVDPKREKDGLHARRVTLETTSAVAVDGTAIRMPFGDLTVSEGRLVRWLRKPGERVSEKETVVEVETDKAVVEIEAPASGVLGPQLRAAGDVVKMGETIGSVKRA